METDAFALCGALVTSGAVTAVQAAVQLGSDEPQQAAFGAASLGSRFALASLTKPLLAVACLVACDEEALELDQSIRRVVPAAAADVTLRELLSHGSGLPPDDVAARRLQLTDEATWLDVAARYLAVEPTAPPRQRRTYSNAGYAVAAAVLEHATGIGHRDYIAEAVLEPIGMASTTLGAAPDAAGVMSVAEPGLLGHDQQLFNGARFRTLGLPQSGAYGTAADYLRLLRVVLLGGRLDDGRQLLSPESALELVTNQLGALPGGVGEFMEWDRCDWGLGFELRDGKDTHWTGSALSPTAATHFGASGTLAVIDPQRDLVAVVLANRGTYSRWMLEPGGWGDICAALVA